MKVLDELAAEIEANEDPVKAVELAYRFRQVTRELLDAA